MFSKLQNIRVQNFSKLKVTVRNSSVCLTRNQPVCQPKLCSPPQLSDIKFDYLKKSEHFDAIKIVTQVFLKDEPMIRAFGVSLDNRNQNIFKELVSSGIARNQSIAAKCKWNQKLIGAAINHDISPEIDYDELVCLAEKAENQNLEHLRNLLNAWALMAKCGKPYKCNNNIFEIGMVAVHPSFRGIKVAEQLIRKSIELAIINKFEMVTIDCTNPITEKIARKLGFKLIWKQKLSSFRNLTSEGKKTNVVVSIYNKCIKNDVHRASNFGLLQLTQCVPPKFEEYTCLESLPKGNAHSDDC